MMNLKILILVLFTHNKGHGWILYLKINGHGLPVSR